MDTDRQPQVYFKLYYCKAVLPHAKAYIIISHNRAS
jgi:hypothetical protein